MHFLPRRRALVVVPVLIFFIFAIALFPLKRSYVFYDNRTDKLAGYLPLEETDFQIKYIHSIHLSEVLESYKVLPDNRLKLVELEYEDFNIGMPSNAGEGETFVEKDGKYFIKNMKRELADFRLFVGNVDAGLYFLTGEKEFDLKKRLERGKSYTFRVQRLSVFQQLKGVKLNEQ